FFFKQKTAYEITRRDWSSDVCSSDLRARVLRLVEDDERVVERAPAHEGKRRDLDHALLHVSGQPVRIEHVVERVEERPQVRIHLLEEGSGQEPEALPRLHRRSRQYDSPDLAVRQ